MKRFLSLILTVELLLSIMPTGMFKLTVNAATTSNIQEFMGGSGTVDDPYLISNRRHLNNVRNYLNAHFELICDIIFDDEDFAYGGDFYNSGAGFIPIGDKSSTFRGTFDGNGYTIKNIHITVSSSENAVCAGLFAYNAGMIKNLGITDSVISITTSYKSNFVGAIVGYNEGTIQNCFNTSTVSATYDYSSYDINPFNYAGGILGVNAYGGTITNCYNTGDVSSYALNSAYSGGIAGDNSGGRPNIITNCYNTGTVSACSVRSDSAARSGGIAGSNSANIENCYNIGTTYATADKTTDVGGIVGINYGATTNCFYADIVFKGVGSGTDTAIKCTDDELRQQSTFVCFDFENTWMFDTSLDVYRAPVLKSVKHVETLLEENTNDFAGGCGTYYKPYLISNQTHLSNVKNYLDAHFKLLCDIDFNGASIEPIGCYDSTAFTGFFDGNGYAIKNLHINISSKHEVSVGLFGYNSGTITNLGMIDGSVNVTSPYDVYAGGIVGYNYGTVTKSYNANSITAETTHTSVYYETYAGGIVGYNKGTVTNSYNVGVVSVSVYPKAYTGGIAGYNTGTIANDYNSGIVAAISSDYNAYSGGVVGYNTGAISDCYNTGGGVSSTGYSYAVAGGLTGYNTNGTIKNCYNIGAVSATYKNTSGVGVGAFAGGIAGYNSGTTINCYFLDNIFSGVGTGNGTTIKCTAEQLKQQTTFSGFNFEEIWIFDEKLENHPYPILKNIVHLELENKTDFAGGHGTMYSPYLISNINHLNNVSFYLGAHFKLLCDIDIKGTSFTPIGGTSYSAFFGTFDGNGYSIKNINVVISSYDAVNAGVFGYNKGTIKNMGIVGGSISAKWLYGATPHTITAGGIAGRNSGKISNCYNTGAVTARGKSAWTGGIAGVNIGTITNCYNTGAVTATGESAYAGGIAGENNDYKSTGIITNCYNIGEITSSDYAGGIAGASDSNISNCYYLNTISQGVGQGLDSTTRRAESSLKKQSTFAGFDFCFVWEIDSSTGYEYPQLIKKIRALSIPSQPTNNTYVVGLNPDFSGASLKVEYELANVTKEKFVQITLDMLEDFNNQIVGVQEVYVSYSDLVSDNTLVLNGLPRAITSMKVTTSPTKLTYVYGQPTNFNGTKITVYYNDNTSEVVSSGLSFAYDSAVGTVPITVSYKGFADTFNITVKERIVQQVTFTEPTKVSYLEGNELDLSGGYFKVVFVSDDNYTETISLDMSMISGYDKDTPGYQTVTATYAGQSKTFLVNIIAADYVIVFKDWDDSILSSGIYHKGEPVIPPATPSKMPDDTYTYDFAGWDSNVVNCAGDATYTATYTSTYIDYTVVFKNWNGDVLSTKTYHYGDKVTAPTNPTKAADSTYTYTFAGWDSDVVNCAGDATYTATYSKIAITITSIEVTTKPNKLIYFKGESFDKTGMVVTAYYNNDTSAVITDFTITGDTSTNGTQTVIISYLGMQDSFEVKVVIKGDIDCNGVVNSNDAIYLLRNTLFAALYPVVVEDDIDGNGVYNSQDAIYLLRHTLFPNLYPLK